MKRFILAAALAATLSLPAFAASDTFSMDVDYAPSKLETRAGAEAEYDSIRRQIAHRCEAENASHRFLPVYIERRCTARTVDQAVRRIDHPVLSQVHADRR
ncbi:MAG: UrcA family protein [Hyphomonas sp.]